MSGRVEFDRTVGMGLVVTLLVQTGGALMWAGKTSARLAELEAEIQVAFDVGERLARLEGESAIMRESLRRIERAVHDDR